MLTVGIFLIVSCQNDDNEKNITEKNTTEFVEYFNFEIDGVNFAVNDSDHIAGTVYPSDETGVINFDFFGEIPAISSEENVYRGVFFKVCFYDGPGTYYTGTDETISWAFNWTDSEIWENHYNYENEPGIVIITSANNSFVEGTFEYEGYNPNLETETLVKGNFGLKLETPEDYIKM